MSTAFVLVQQHADWRQKLALANSGHKKTESASAREGEGDVCPCLALAFST